MPLKLANGRRGALTLYADEPNFFSPDILGLTEKFAADVVQGIEVLLVRQRFAEQAEALRESEQRWQFALDGAGDGVWDWNIATGRIFFSARLVRMFGYEPGEFKGTLQEWEAHIHADDLARVQAELAVCLRGETDVLHQEYRVRCRDGSYRCVLDRGKVIERDAAGRPVRMIGTLTDVTELRRAHQQLALLRTAVQAMPAGTPKNSTPSCGKRSSAATFGAERSSTGARTAPNTANT